MSLKNADGQTSGKCVSFFQRLPETFGIQLQWTRLLVSSSSRLGIRNFLSEPPAVIISLLKILSSFSRTYLSAPWSATGRAILRRQWLLSLHAKIALRNKSMKSKRPPAVLGKISSSGGATFRSVIPAELHQLRWLHSRFCNQSQLMKICVNVFGPAAFTANSSLNQPKSKPSHCLLKQTLSSCSSWWKNKVPQTLEKVTRSWIK